MSSHRTQLPDARVQMLELPRTKDLRRDPSPLPWFVRLWNWIFL